MKNPLNPVGEVVSLATAVTKHVVGAKDNVRRENEKDQFEESQITSSGNNEAMLALAQARRDVGLARERTRQIKTGGFLLSLLFFTGVGVYAINRVVDTAAHVADTGAGIANNALKAGTDSIKAGADAIKTFATPQQATIVDVVNVVDGLRLLGTFNIAQTDLHGTGTMVTTGEFLGISTGMGSRTATEVCGKLTESVDLTNPNITFTAQALNSSETAQVGGAPRVGLDVQIPVSAINLSFAPTIIKDPVTGSAHSACPGSTSSDGTIRRIGSVFAGNNEGSRQQILAALVQSQLMNSCLPPMQQMTIPGTANALRGAIGVGVKAEAAVQVGQSPNAQTGVAQQAMELLNGAQITVTFVKQNKDSTTLVDISGFDFNLPTVPSTSDVASALGEDPENVTLTVKKTCSMSMEASNNLATIEENPQQYPISSSTPTTTSGGAK